MRRHDLPGKDQFGNSTIRRRVDDRRWNSDGTFLSRDAVALRKSVSDHVGAWNPRYRPSGLADVAFAVLNFSDGRLCRRTGVRVSVSRLRGGKIQRVSLVSSDDPFGTVLVSGVVRQRDGLRFAAHQHSGVGVCRRRNSLLSADQQIRGTHPDPARLLAGLSAPFDLFDFLPKLKNGLITGVSAPVINRFLLTF